MLYTKDGYPEINEIVICTVKKIYGNTTFVFLDEYEKEGVLTIAEIAPGRIRNLREFVVENKVIVCKVLRVDEKGNRIDVSLRRVPIPVMKEKLEEIKKEEFSEKVYLDISKEIGITKDQLFEKTYEPIFEEFSTVFEALYEIMLDNDKIQMFKKLNDKEKKIFVNIVNDKIKPEEVYLKKKFNLFSYSSAGINIVKNSIKNSLEPLNYNKVRVIYLASGEFEIIITHDDMKSADKIFDKFISNLQEEVRKNKLEFKLKN